MKSVKPIQIVDLFAGPGGLGEGFSSFDGGRGFDIIVSAEKDPVARKTLRLRAFFRLLRLNNPNALDDYYDYCNGRSSQAWSSRSEREWLESGNEARCITLGSEEGNTELDEILSERLDRTRPWVLIGGPPCQAYSLVGRARNRGNLDYRAEEDHRHFLYREYLRIIQRYKPAIFVMENVKGILSSKVGGKEIFPEILQDLSDPDAALGAEISGRKYRICSLTSNESYGAGNNLEAVTSSNFIIRAEKNGVPQSRHRVILLGIAVDEAGEVPSFPKLVNNSSDVTVSDVLDTLPRLRSRLSREKDSAESWYLEVTNQLDALRSELESRGTDPLLWAELNIARSGMVDCSLDTGGGALSTSKRRWKS